ncbi:ATP-binding cassette domain-containing protein [Dokdonella sp.]|uniref:ATP-binding cassette domain-containing protein n=1 Tax=Dokdonella sp. TaxID=2291710 RepID=UPI002F40ECEC
MCRNERPPAIAALSCLHTHPLVRRPRDDLVLDGIGLDVPEGSIQGFLGPNGAGKTTMLRERAR